jgi:hypothetical protein
MWVVQVNVYYPHFVSICIIMVAFCVKMILIKEFVG